MTNEFVGLVGTVYLIHLKEPFKHARHYLGWSEDVEARFREHVCGRGSPLLAAARAAGIEFEIVRTWPGDRGLEAQLKGRRPIKGRFHGDGSPVMSGGKNNSRLCPICKGDDNVLPGSE
jgi:hypothetical protein